MLVFMKWGWPELRSRPSSAATVPVTGWLWPPALSTLLFNQGEATIENRIEGRAIRFILQQRRSQAVPECCPFHTDDADGTKSVKCLGNRDRQPAVA